MEFNHITPQNMAELKKLAQAGYRKWAVEDFGLKAEMLDAIQNEVANIQKMQNTQILLVGSTSTTVDKSLKKDLLLSGVKVIDFYVDNIQEIYQMADCYIFPTQSAIDAVEIPLSVLEAMYCNIPVLTERFGGLVDMFKEGDGFWFYENKEELNNKLRMIKSKKSDCNTRNKVSNFLC